VGLFNMLNDAKAEDDLMEVTRRTVYPTYGYTDKSGAWRISNTSLDAQKP
jgi:hypothetical protein